VRPDDLLVDALRLRVDGMATLVILLLRSSRILLSSSFDNIIIRRAPLVSKLVDRVRDLGPDFENLTSACAVKGP
jgi:hypothetical protein